MLEELKKSVCAANGVAAVSSCYVHLGKRERH
jgi:hypothetical protein